MHPARRSLWLLLLAGICLASGAARAAEPGLVIVSSERSPVYQEAADALLTELARLGQSARQVPQFTVAELVAQPRTARLTVALGTEACAALVQRPVPGAVLCTLLPQASFERILRESARRVSPHLSALYLNQPLGRQLDLVRLALPEARRIGVLYAAASGPQAPALAAAAQARGQRIVSARLEPGEPVYNPLQQVLAESDVLLALADPQIYNAGSIQNILLTSFRAQVPMLAFSPAYVRAGALLAVYSTPAQIGQQAAGRVRAVLQGQALGAPEHPRLFSVSVNEHVARSLGRRLEPEALAERLRLLEQGP